jgi:hypothetical protein
VGTLNTGVTRFACAALLAFCAGTVLEASATSERAQKRPGPSGCRLLPRGDAFKRKVNHLAVAENSDQVMAQILANGSNLHPYFGPDGGPWGIPFNVVRARHPRVPVHVRAYPGHSDPGPHPIPPDARVENSADRHVLVLQRDGPDRNKHCRLIELFNAYPRSGGGWIADQASVFRLGKRLPQRPEGWGSADAAGLPILPGLVRFGEVRKGWINHAIRMTITRTRRAHMWPATHHASNDCGRYLPPMGMRLRLDDKYPIGHMHPHAQVIATALKHFGAIVADNGKNPRSRARSTRAGPTTRSTT